MKYSEKRAAPRVRHQQGLTVARCGNDRYGKAITHNYSDGGLFMETSMAFNAGDCLHLRMNRYPPKILGYEAFRARMAQVKSCRLLYGGKAPRWGIGVSFIEKLNIGSVRPSNNQARQTRSNDPRQKAEQYLVDYPQTKMEVPQTDGLEILHELQVHQIELEMQNDELRRTQVENARTLSKYSDLYDFAPVGYFTFDPNGLILETNLTGANLLGIERSRLVKLPFSNCVHRDDRDTFRLHCYKFLQSQTPQKSEIRLIRSNGELVYARLESALIPSIEDYTNKVSTVVIDITERKLAEQQRRLLEKRLAETNKMEAIGTLAGGVAHDFNNLLMGIQGSISLMRIDCDPDDPDNDHLARMEEMILSATDLTKQMLGFARGGKYFVRPLNLNKLIQTSVDLFGRTRRDITIETNLQSDLGAVEADQTQIEQVFLNLFINAGHAMPHGGRLAISSGRAALTEVQVQPNNLPAGDYIRISVTDTGIGMDVQTRRKIFEPFFTTKDMGRGTGLGLASAHGIITNHGGFIEVVSKPSAGTTFIIFLPASSASVKKKPQDRRELLTGSETVLIIDDEAQIRKVVSQMLAGLGYQVLLASSGKEAIERYDPATIDLVILDLTMPGMDGGQTFDRLCELNPEVRVILASGFSKTGQADDIIKRGCKGFIQKPFSLEELSGIVREILDR